MIELPRVIVFDGQPLPDLNPALPIEDVLRLHAATHPALVTAALEGPVTLHGQRTYTAHRRAANKG